MPEFYGLWYNGPVHEGYKSTNISGDHCPVRSLSVKIGCVQELETSIHPITGYLLKIEHSPPKQEYTVYMSIWVFAELIETKWNVQLQMRYPLVN